jgi:uncharacterized membrane protein (Fun14 family)
MNEPNALAKPSLPGAAINAFRQLAGWKRMLLGVVAMLTALGGTGALVGQFQPRPDDYRQAARTVESLQNIPRASLTPDQAEQLQSAQQTQRQYTGFLYDSLSPHTWRAGLSFIGAFVLGFAFRQFVKTTALIVGIALAAVAALTYFDIVDLSSVRSGVEKSSAWLTKIGTYAKDVVMAWFPSTVTSFAGFFLGFMKR